MISKSTSRKECARLSLSFLFLQVMSDHFGVLGGVLVWILKLVFDFKYTFLSSIFIPYLFTEKFYFLEYILPRNSEYQLMLFSVLSKNF